MPPSRSSPDSPRRKFTPLPSDLSPSQLYAPRVPQPMMGPGATPSSAPAAPAPSPSRRPLSGGLVRKLEAAKDDAERMLMVRQLAKDQLKELADQIETNVRAGNVPESLKKETWVMRAIQERARELHELERDVNEKTAIQNARTKLDTLEQSIHVGRSVIHNRPMPKEWTSTEKKWAVAAAATIALGATLYLFWRKKNAPTNTGHSWFTTVMAGSTLALGGYLLFEMWGWRNKADRYIREKLDALLGPKNVFIESLEQLHAPALPAEKLMIIQARLNAALARIPEAEREAFLTKRGLAEPNFTKKAGSANAFERTFGHPRRIPGIIEPHKYIVTIAGGNVRIEKKVDAPAAGPEAVPATSGSTITALLDIHGSLAAEEGLRTDTARQGVVTLMENPALRVADIPLKDLLDTASPAFAGHLGRMPDELSKSALRFLAKVCKKDVQTNGLLQNKSVKNGAGAWQPIDLNALTLGRYLDYVGPAMRTVQHLHQARKRHPLGFAPHDDRNAFQKAFAEMSPNHSMLAEDLRSADGREALRALDPQLESHRDVFINLLSTIGANPMSMYNDAMVATVPEPQRAIFKRALTALKGKFDPPPHWLTRYGHALPAVMGTNDKLTEALKSTSIADAMQLWFMRQQAYIRMTSPDTFDDASVPANHQALGRLQLWLKVVELIARVDPVVARNYYNAVMAREPAAAPPAP